MEVSEGNSPARGVWRWLRVHVRALGILVGLLLLYTLAGFLLVPRVARNAAINYVQHDLGRHLTIGSLSFNPFTLATEIRGLALSETDGAHPFPVQRFLRTGDHNEVSGARKTHVQQALVFLDRRFPDDLTSGRGLDVIAYRYLLLLAIGPRPVPQKAVPERIFGVQGGSRLGANAVPH